MNNNEINQNINENTAESIERTIHIHYSVGENDKRVVIDEIVPVTEDVYKAFKRPLWAEDKRKKRKSRCQIGKGNGKTKRCTKDCSQCEFFHSGMDLSLNKMEEDGTSPAHPKSDLAEAAAYSELLRELFTALDELDPDSRSICKLIMAGKTDNEIAEAMGYNARTTFSYHKYKLLDKLQARLKDYR